MSFAAAASAFFGRSGGRGKEGTPGGKRKFFVFFLSYVFPFFCLEYLVCFSACLFVGAFSDCLIVCLFAKCV